MADNKIVPMSQFLQNPNTKSYLENLLGERTPQFVQSLTVLASSNDMLKNCERNSLLSCALKAASMNLPFDQNLGFAWAVPYAGVATFQIGWKGFVQLAMRTGQYKELGAREVREGELKGRTMIGDPIIEWLSDDDRDSKPIIGYMAGFTTVNGFQKVSYWTVKEIEKHATKYSQAYKSGRSTPWKSDFDSMALKTVLKLLLSKFGIMSTELASAVKADHAAIRINMETGEEEVTPDYIDNKLVKGLSSESQKEYLQKYGVEKVYAALEAMEAKSMNDITEAQEESFLDALATV